MWTWVFGMARMVTMNFLCIIVFIVCANIIRHCRFPPLHSVCPFCYSGPYFSKTFKFSISIQLQSKYIVELFIRIFFRKTGPCYHSSFFSFFICRSLHSFSLIIFFSLSLLLFQMQFRCSIEIVTNIVWIHKQSSGVIVFIVYLCINNFLFLLCVRIVVALL